MFIILVHFNKKKKTRWLDGEVAPGVEPDHTRVNTALYHLDYSSCDYISLYPSALLLISTSYRDKHS